MQITLNVRSALSAIKPDEGNTIMAVPYPVVSTEESEREQQWREGLITNQEFINHFIERMHDRPMPMSGPDPKFLAVIVTQELNRRIEQALRPLACQLANRQITFKF